MKKSKLLSVSTAVLMALYGTSQASGYRIPEASIKGTALSSANIANARGADASYYNPAAMAFNDDKAYMEGSLLLFHIGEIDYAGDSTTDLTALGGAPITVNNINESSEIQNIPAAAFHYSSPAVNDWRFGLSVVSPFGLTMEWTDPVSKGSAEKFSLMTLEINPTFAYKVADNLAIGGGVRSIYTDGEVKSSSALTSRNLTGDSWDFGYNLALLYKPTQTTSLAATYRSAVDLSVTGKATLNTTNLAGVIGAPLNAFGSQESSGASLDVVTPEVLSLAAAFDISDATTIELVWDRTYWSDYKDLDFNYSSINDPLNNAVFDTPVAKNWKDTDAFRIGITHSYNDKLDLMFGYVRDEAAAPNATLSFELPDSDKNVFSVGAMYQYSDDLKIGGAILGSFADDLTVNNDSLNGKFTYDPIIVSTIGFEMSF